VSPVSSAAPSRFWFGTHRLQLYQENNYYIFNAGEIYLASRKGDEEKGAFCLAINESRQIAPIYDLGLSLLSLKLFNN
jgi:hypothetical protein